MPRFAMPVILWLTLLLVVICFGCSKGGHVDPVVPDDERDSGKLSIYLKDTVVTNGRISVSLLASGAEAVSALSLRIGFSEEYLEPVDVEWSPDFVGEGSTFQLLNQRGYVPLAFAKAGETIGSPDALEICKLRFKLKNGTKSIPWIIDDPDHLIAYDLSKTRLNVLAGGDVK